MLLNTKKDEELEALLHEDSCQAQAEFSESLGVDRTKVLKCLKALGMTSGSVRISSVIVMSRSL